MAHLHRTLLIGLFALAFSVSACGVPGLFDELQDATSELENVADTVDAELPNADIDLTFSQDATDPVQPDVGEGFSSQYGTYTVLVGSMLSFESVRQAEGEPAVSGVVYGPIQVGATIELTAENQQHGTLVLFALDEETSWFAVEGTITIESVRPLHLVFDDLVMHPFSQAVGSFTMNGSLTWVK
jgi:hypothetical protein